MSFDIDVAGVGLASGAAVFKSFKDDLHLAFHLDSALSKFLDSRLDTVPAGACASHVSYGSPAASWNPGGGPVLFGLQGGASGGLQIVQSGTLVTYMDGVASPEPRTIEVPAGSVSLVLTLNFNISANAAATYSGGAYGVKAALDSTETYAVTYFKAFPPETTVREAVATIFKGFVLPLHMDTLAQMDEGDYLLHAFDGNLHVAFGAYAGLQKVLYAGQASVDVVKAFGSPLATVLARTRPTVGVGAELSFSFAYESHFEALLSRAGGTATMHLFRSSKETTGGALKAGLIFDGNTKASIAMTTDTVRETVVAAVGGAGSAGGFAVGELVKAASGEVGKYVTEVDDKLASWLNRANGLQTNLEVAIEATHSRLVLAAYSFDLGSPELADGWKAAMGGDLVAAMKSAAVTLEVGSGLEKEYRQKTSFDVNFFHLWKFETWSDYAAKTSMVYAGNNVFHLQAQIGRTVQTESMGAMHSMDLYFTADADSDADAQNGAISAPHVNLQIELTAQKDARAMGAIATMLSAMGAGPVAEGLARDLRAFVTRSGQGTAQLRVTIPPAAYRRINCDAYANGKPGTTSTSNDELNWKTFAQAADDLEAWPLRDMSTVSLQNLLFLKTFAAWEELNVAATGGSAPNRLQTGNTWQWPSGFPQVDNGSRTLIAYSMGAGQAFMNFCEAVHLLACTQDVDAAGATWNGVVGLITEAAKKDVNVDFLRPAALALVRLCGTAATVVSGPVGAAIPAEHFAVSMVM